MVYSVVFRQTSLIIFAKLRINIGKIPPTLFFTINMDMFKKIGKNIALKFCLAHCRSFPGFQIMALARILKRRYIKHITIIGLDYHELGEDA